MEMMIDWFIHWNTLLAAQEVGKVYPIDSGNLSTGIGLLVIEAAERIAKGMAVAQICQEVNDLKAKVQTSFVIDSLTYLYEGADVPHFPHWAPIY